MSVSLSQADDSSRIEVEGVADIACASELKTALIEALTAGKAIRVSVQRVSDLDVTAVQLFWAAKREAKRLGVSFAFKGKVSEEIRNSLANVGFGELAIFD